MDTQKRGRDVINKVGLGMSISLAPNPWMVYIKKAYGPCEYMWIRPSWMDTCVLDSGVFIEGVMRGKRGQPA